MEPAPKPSPAAVVLPLLAAAGGVFSVFVLFALYAGEAPSGGAFLARVLLYGFSLGYLVFFVPMMAFGYLYGGRSDGLVLGSGVLGLLCGILFVLGLAPDPFGAQPMVYVLGVLLGLVLALVLAGYTALFLWCRIRAVHHLFVWVAPLCCSGLLVASTIIG